MKSGTGTTGERGIVLVTTLMLMLLMSALLAGFSVAVLSDQQFRGVDKERATAFYASHAGLEKLTSDLGGLFAGNFAPNGSQVNALELTEPSLQGIQFLAADNNPGYTISFTPDTNGNPASQVRQIQNGPFEGLMGQVTRYQVDVTARTEKGSDAHLRREMQTVTIPIFQFGTFSDMELGFHSAAAFDFGGRVHANGNLYLKANATLWLRDKVTTAGEIIRAQLMNGNTSGYTSAVNVLRAPGLYRDLQENEGSLVAGAGSAQNEPTWTNLSIGTYNGNIRSSRTGGKRLDLPLITVGGTPIDLIRRPAASNEDTANPTLFDSRYFSMASLRILLSDTAADLTNLPTVTPVAPMPLDWAAGVPGSYNGGIIGASNPPLAVSGPVAATQVNASGAAGATTIRVASFAGFTVPGSFFVKGTQVYCTGTATNTPGTRFTGCTGVPAVVSTDRVDTGYRVTPGTASHGGFIKIEKQDINSVWTDVTGEILTLGLAGRNLAVGGCAEPHLNAVIRLQRLVDRPSTTGAGNNCGNGSTVATDYIPNTIFDPREGNRRDYETTSTATVYLGGVMHYIELDVNNLRRWFQGTIGASGSNAMNVTGYVVYFSDRRGNRNAANAETGELGFEDIVNPASGTGADNGTLDAGEDLNTSTTLETYGGVPRPGPGAQAPLTAAATLRTAVNPEIARVNPPVFFRRALKLTNGGLGNIIMPGLTVTSENPVYVEGNYNANNTGFSEPNAATAVIVDSLTLLSNSWNDRVSFTSPQNSAGRPATETWYRMAVIAGKGRPFAQPSGQPANFGTDGGIHNFLRFIEEWGSRTVHYRGSIAILYTNRQGVGTFKQAGNDNVYGPPGTRDFAFDLDFLQPALMPPRTPVFRDINTLGFTQITAIGQ